MSADESKLHRLAGPDAAHRAVTLAHDFSAAHALPSDAGARLAILVEELVLNLFDHGGLGPGDVVELGLWHETGAVRLLLIDRGAPFDPRATAEDAAIPDRGGGAGLALVGAWAETVDYRTADGANRLELRIPT